jgi:hypothetical protein
MLVSVAGFGHKAGPVTVRQTCQPPAEASHGWGRQAPACGFVAIG